MLKKDKMLKYNWWNDKMLENSGIKIIVFSASRIVFSLIIEVLL